MKKNRLFVLVFICLMFISCARGVDFKDGDYPVIYELTEKSYEDFKGQVRDNYKKIAKENNMTGSSDYLRYLDFLESTDGRTWAIDLFGNVADCGTIEFMNDKEVYAGYYTLSYKIDGEILYITGDYAGIIRKDRITIYEYHDGVEFALVFYRQKASTESTLSDSSITRKVIGSWKFDIDSIIDKALANEGIEKGSGAYYYARNILLSDSEISEMSNLEIVIKSKDELIVKANGEEYSTKYIIDPVSHILTIYSVDGTDIEFGSFNYDYTELQPQGLTVGVVMKKM